MPSVWVSPTEPDAVKTLGEVSSLPETKGVDVLWPAQGRLWGVQRKEFGDLLASRGDGRLEVELGQMKGLGGAVLIVEGVVRWTDDGELLDGWAKLSRRQFRGMLWSVRNRGVWVEHTESLDDTVTTIRWLIDWSQKQRHSGLRGRPSPSGNWGHVSDKDWAIHLLTSFPGVGLGTATNIYEHFNGVLPLMWTVGEAGLMEVPGVGEHRARKLSRSLEREHGEQQQRSGET